jgi:methylthioribose-1-phosphate isomerase
MKTVPAEASNETLFSAVLEEATVIQRKDLEGNRALGRAGAALLPDDCTVLTHCNAGALATGGHGTALGVIRSAREAGKTVRVYACETRPLLQGARLTVWELMQDGFDVTLLCDNMAASLMKSRRIDAEERAADEVRRLPGGGMLPADYSIWNPAFDVTDASLISAIITEKGAIVPPFAEGIASFLSE